MSTKKIRVGVVGLGGIGNHHASVLNQNPDAELVALFDSNPKAVEKMHEAYPGAKACESFQQFLSTPGMSAIVVGTPNNMHAQYSIAAAKKGLHVLCEKPLAMDPAEAKKMVKAIKDNNVIGMTNFSYRWIPSFRIARDMAREGKFGDIHRIHAKYLQGWLRNPNDPIVWRNIKEFAGFGVLGDLGSHMIDSICFITGAKPKRAVGVHSIKIPTKKDPATGGRAKVTTDTNAQFMVDFGEFVAIFETSQVELAHGNHLSISMGGAKASCQLCCEDREGYSLALDESGCAMSWGTSVPRVEVPKDYKAGGPCANDFILAIKNKLKDYPSFEDGLLVQKTIDAVHRSTESGQWERI